MFPCRLLTAALLLLVPDAVSAQPQVTLPAPKVGACPTLSPVPVPPALSVSLSEAQGLLAFAHERSYREAHLSLVKLDAKGNPAPNCKSWMVPRPPEALAKSQYSVVAVALHPKLPVLYAWQDVGLNYAAALTAQPPEWLQFDHLLVYNIAKDPPELMVSLCRGETTHFGTSGGSLLVDTAGEFLYVPSVCDAKDRYLRAGRFRLDADGLPLVDDADAKLPLPARLKKLAERNAARTVAVAQMTPVEYVHTFPLTPSGGAHSFNILSKDLIVSGCWHGVWSWRPGDKLATVEFLPLKFAGTTLVAPHPTLPYLFATATNTDSFFRVAHSEGHLSLLPLQITLPETRLFSAPVAIEKGSRIAVGGHYHVYLVALDKNGDPQPDVLKVPVLAAAARTLVFSERWQRLYVGVEISK
jgi:hypothetical protein